MQTYGSIIPGGPTLSRLLPKAAGEARGTRPLSRDAKRRLAAVRWYEEHGRNASRTARHFSVSRSSLHFWLTRYREGGVRALEDRSRRPKRVRKLTWDLELEAKVLALRQAHPRWGKDMLTPILRREGVAVSVSMVGRILSRLKRQGRLLPATLADPCIVSSAYVRPYARRKPKDCIAQRPGDLVQVDSADVRWQGDSHTYKHSSARDYVSRWDVLGVFGRATALSARDFLSDLLARAPFPVRAIQVDGGSEFKADLEAACQEKGVLFSCCRRVRPSSTAASGALSARTRRSSTSCSIRPTPSPSLERSCSSRSSATTHTGHTRH